MCLILPTLPATSVCSSWVWSPVGSHGFPRDLALALLSFQPPFTSLLVKHGSQRLLPTLPAERTRRSSWGQRAPPNAQSSVSAQQGPEPASLWLWPQFPPFVKETEQHFLLREQGLLHPHHLLSPQTKWGVREADRHEETGASALSLHTWEGGEPQQAFPSLLHAPAIWSDWGSWGPGCWGKGAWPWGSPAA